MDIFVREDTTKFWIERAHSFRLVMNYDDVSVWTANVPYKKLLASSKSERATSARCAGMLMSTVVRSF